MHTPGELTAFHPGGRVGSCTKTVAEDAAAPAGAVPDDGDEDEAPFAFEEVDFRFGLGLAAAGAGGGGGGGADDGDRAAIALTIVLTTARLMMTMAADGQAAAFFRVGERDDFFVVLAFAAVARGDIDGAERGGRRLLLLRAR